MSATKKHYWIYVLELNGGKYYVGLSTQKNAEGRIKQHKSGFFSAKWVKAHGYKSTMQVHDLGLTTFEEAEKVETQLTFDMMQQYGVNNVRGGKLTYSGGYVDRFGRLFFDDDWYALTIVVLFWLIIAYFMVDKYFLD